MGKDTCRTSSWPASEAAQVADTPETRDGLLTTLLEHRRAVAVTPLPGQPRDLALGDSGRTLFADLGPRVVTWPVGSASAPTTAVDDWYYPRNIDAAPDTGAVAVLGLMEGEVRAGVYSADGRQQLLVGDRAIGGWPWEVAFSQDGRSLLFLVANELPSGNWEGSVREVRLHSGRARTIHPGVVRSSDPDVWIDATFADDGSSVAAWSSETDGRANVLDLEDGTRTRLRLEPRPVDSLDVVPLPTGAAQLWADGALTLYDEDGQPAQVLEAHQEPVQDILVAADGDWAATTGADGMVILWEVDPATGLWLRRESLSGHGGAVTGAELAPDGRTLVTAARDNSVISWDVSTDAGFGSSYPGLHDRWIANRPDAVVPGRLLVAATRPVADLGDGNTAPARDTLRVAATFFDPRTGRVVDEIPVGTTLGGALFGSSVAISPDRSMVAVTSGFATTVLDSRTREVLGRVALPPTSWREPSGGQPPELVWAAGWTRDGDRLLLAAEGDPYDSRDGGLVVVDPATWTVERRVDLGGSAQVIEQSPDGTWLAVGNAETETSDSTPELWILDSATLETEHTLRLGDDDFPFDMSFSPDGRWLAAAGSLGRLTVFDTRSWARTHDPAGLHDQFVQQVEWTPDARTVVTSGADGRVSLYDAERDLVRAVPLPGSTGLTATGNLQQGYTHLLPPRSDEIVALSGERPGHRYPMDPSVWLAEACAVAGRDLTEDEWARYLPDRPYHRTCTELP